MEKLMAHNAEENPVRWLAPVSRWACWEPTETEGAAKMPEIPFIDAGLRRRLSLFARMSLKVAHDCAGELSGIRIVFASRHGDLARTTSMLVDLADKELLSPTSFSMSVLNACIGIYSIAKKELAPSTAISSGASSLGYGLLEASMQLAAVPQTPVLFIYADEPAPALYGLGKADIPAPLAIALLLESDAPAVIQCETSPTQHANAQASQPHTFLACLKDKGQAQWHDTNQLWKWSWHERPN